MMRIVIPQGLTWLQRVRFMAGNLERVALESFGQSITVPLPGEEFERFMLSEGAFCEWKSLQCPAGKTVLFKAHGPTAMASHKHTSPEILIALSGELVVRIAGVPYTLKAGDTITTQPGQEHSAHYLTAGECLCIWPGMKEEALTIDILA